RFSRDWSSDVCSSDLLYPQPAVALGARWTLALASGPAGDRHHVRFTSHGVGDLREHRSHADTGFDRQLAYSLDIRLGEHAQPSRSEERRVGNRWSSDA